MLNIRVAPHCITARRGLDPAASLASFFLRDYSQYLPMSYWLRAAQGGAVRRRPVRLPARRRRRTRSVTRASGGVLSVLAVGTSGGSSG
jgi:hypothetical protein